MSWRVVLGGLSIAAVLVAAGASVAATSGPNLAQVEAEQQRREQDREAARAAADAARSDLAQLQAQLNELNLAASQGDHVISDKRLRLAALNAREAELRAKLGGDQAQLARLLSVLALIRRDPPPALLVDPSKVRDAVNAAILVRAITPELTRRAKALEDQLAELQRTRRAAATASEDLFTTESAVADRRAQIEALAAQKTALERKANDEANAAAQDAEALASRAEALRDLARGLAKAPPAPSAPEQPNPENDGPFGRSEPFTPPVAGEPVRRFGQADPDGGARSLGWTWRTPSGATVVAPATGIVEYADPLKDWGVVLILRLGGGYHLVLAGLATAIVQRERVVKAGDPVGRMAADGGSSEFYLEIRKDGAPVDPARWLPPMRGLRR